MTILAFIAGAIIGTIAGLGIGAKLVTPILDDYMGYLRREIDRVTRGHDR